jgi:hypothetical protein
MTPEQIREAEKWLFNNTGFSAIPYHKHALAIKYALKLAEKVLGEPSFDMFTEGAFYLPDMWKERTPYIFKAMINQACAEIEREAQGE